jgi:kynurenine formamidase
MIIGYNNRVIDLTYPLHNGMFKYPSDAEPEISLNEAISEEKEEYGYSEGDLNPSICAVWTKYNSGFVSMNIRNHHGTHIDAPCHKIPKSKTLESYDIWKFQNKALLVDLTKTNLLERKRREISLQDIGNFLSGRDFIADRKYGALVFYTGFSDEMEKYEGKLFGEKKKDFEKTFPYFEEKAIDEIIKSFSGLNILGIDSFAVDPKGSNSEIHRKLFAKDILPLETLVNLKDLKKNLSLTGEFELYSFPILIAGSDAAQARVYAVRTL